jgi:riboflavin kinase/FMN adenylyltransferase
MSQNRLQMGSLPEPTLSAKAGLKKRTAGSFERVEIVIGCLCYLPLVKIIYGYESLDAPLGPVVMTIGTFDGLHLGHRAIIEGIVERARKTGSKSLVYSFFPPPWRVLGRAQNPYLILTLQDKINLLHEMGVDFLITEEFTPKLQQISHIDFATEVLKERINPLEIHFGYDFAFGKNRLGNLAFLRSFFEGTATEVRPHGAVRINEEIVGCTRIREATVDGRVRDAATWLGRYHFVRGTVVRGRGRGRTIGFPTANIQPSTELIPPAGVYAVELYISGQDQAQPGVANLGFRPTFAEKEFAIEVHLFDCDRSLYGERVQVSFVERIRDEMKFPGPEALVTQITRDANKVRNMLPFAPPPQGAVTWDPKPS